MGIVLNLFGAPGSGKSTAAAYIFSKIQTLGATCDIVNVKDIGIVPEYKGDSQLLAFSKGYEEIKKSLEKYDVVIVEHPLLMTVFYNDDESLFGHFDKMVLKCFNSFDNENIFIKRSFNYKQNGGIYTEADVEDIENGIKMFLSNNGIQFDEELSKMENYEKIAWKVFTDIKYPNGRK